MIFAAEATGEHFWYDGNDLAVGLDASKIIWVPFEDADQDLLSNILETPKRHIFTINKIRYKVVARGNRYEP